MRRALALCALLVAGCPVAPAEVGDRATSPDGGTDRPDGGRDGGHELPPFDAGTEPHEPDAGPPSPVPHRLILVDEGNAAVHHVALDNPALNWTYRVATDDPCCNLVRDVQLVGDDLVMVSRPNGFVELDLAAQGAVKREVTLSPVPGAIEAARRTPDGHTVVAGNGGGAIFVAEFDRNGALVEGHDERFAGANLRGMRLTTRGTFLFTSDSDAGKVLYEGDWDGQARKLFEIPSSVGAGHMTKAVFTGEHEVLLSTGYGASLLRIDTAQAAITQLIGGPDQPRPEHAERDLAAHFYAGFQLLENGDVFVTNWIDHGRGHNGEGYQLIRYDAEGRVRWLLDQRQFPAISSLHNVIVLDGLDTRLLHDDRAGTLEPL